MWYYLEVGLVYTVLGADIVIVLLSVWYALTDSNLEDLPTHKDPSDAHK